MSEEKTTNKTAITTGELNSLELSEKKDFNLLKEFEGDEFNVDGKKFVLKEETTAQFCGESLKDMNFVRESDKDTLYFGREIQNDWDDKLFMFELIEGTSAKGGNKQSGFKDLLMQYAIQLQYKLPHEREFIWLFEGMHEKLKPIFMEYIYNPKGFNYKAAEKTYLNVWIELAGERKAQLETELATNQIDNRMYNNAKMAIDLGVDAVKKYLAGEIKFD